MSWTILVPLLTALVAVATFYEKFYVDKRFDESIRLGAVRLLVCMEETFGRADARAIGTALMFTCMSFLSTFIMYLTIKYLVFLNENIDQAPWWLFPGLVKFFSRWEFIQTIIFGGLVCIAFAAVALVSDFIAAYAIVYMIIYHVLNKITDPKIGPLTYIVAILAVMVVLGKSSLDAMIEVF